MQDDPHIVVAGAGAVGCFVGGLLAAAGKSVTLLLRPGVAAEIRGHGLTLTSFDGMALRVPSSDILLAVDPACLAGADIVLVTVKSHDTAQIGHEIDAHAPAGCPVISLQNGTVNAHTLGGLLPGRDVRAGMVPFNVVPLRQGGFHRATSGEIQIGTGPGNLGQLLSVAHLTVSETPEIDRLLWGKFLLNLNNALNALSGMTLADQLRDRRWRRLMADQWAEALTVLRAAGIRPISTSPVSVDLVPWILRLPTPIFNRVAASMLTIDPQARTSMAHDLMAGRPTEIEAFQGEILRLGQEHGVATPINARVREVTQFAETADEGLPHLPVSVLTAPA